MTSGLAITGPALERAGTLLNLSIESAGIAAGRRSGNTVMIGDIAWANDADYELRDRDRLKVRSTGWAPGLRAIALAGGVPIFVHTHPADDTFFSDADDVVDMTIGVELLRIAGCSEMASLVIGGGADRPLMAMRHVVDGRLRPRQPVRVASTAIGFQPRRARALHPRCSTVKTVRSAPTATRFSRP